MAGFDCDLNSIRSKREREERGRAEEKERANQEEEDRGSDEKGGRESTEAEEVGLQENHCALLGWF